MMANGRIINVMEKESLHGEMDVSILGNINDRKEGYGIFKWEDGREYRGNWQNGKQHGLGMYVASNGLTRKGQWMQGKRLRWIDDD